MECDVYFVDYSAAGDFFLRLSRSRRNSKSYIITTLPSLFYKCQGMSNIKVIFISKFSHVSEETIHPEDINRCKEIPLGFMSKDKASTLYSRVKYALNSIMDKKYDRINLACWSSETIMGSVIRQINNDKRVHKLFFEIANIPGKIFVDSEGVNKASSLYDCPEKVFSYPINEFSFKSWVDNFKNDKLSGVNTAPPQVRLGNKLSFSMLFDFIFVISIGYRMFSYSAILAKLNINKFINKFSKKLNGVNFCSEIPKSYLFFPLQVSSDTQVIINSDVDNLQSIDIILKSTKDIIVIKPHPAERDIIYIFEYLNGLSKENRKRVIITNNNTYELIERSNGVIVINSTLGLEAKIFGKDVKFMGYSFFSKFTNEQYIEHYIGGYLVDCDFFCDNYISCDTSDKIFNNY
ncbi:hypothetical protein [Vibrio coralliirubri]|uniref:capsular polysaccharide export protein, LipB/KpsS family n=1 Tax=Vibrio coralliirubri TaxID=1516159 RepID=UPI00073ECB1A|nr:hypothetical protein [Vibrio coralliirubri]